MEKVVDKTVHTGPLATKLVDAESHLIDADVSVTAHPAIMLEAAELDELDISLTLRM